MLSIADQTEFLFVNPDVVNAPKTLIMGHFTSPEFYADYSKTIMIIHATPDGQEIIGVSMSNTIEQEIIFPEERHSELAFRNHRSLNDLIRSVKLQCYESTGNHNVVTQIIFFRIPALKDDCHSYLFMGYVDKNIPVIKQHSQVFYTENGKIKKGGDAPHKMGSAFGQVFQDKLVFGFGQNLAMHGIAPKDFLDGMKRFYKMAGNPAERNNPLFDKVFEDKQYQVYLKKQNEVFSEKNMDYCPFWMNKEIKEKYEKISYEIIKKMLEEKG